jgi:hypothetical protein
MELLSGHEKVITKSGISLTSGALNRGLLYFGITACFLHLAEGYEPLKFVVPYFKPVFL